jgi:hypothetical protein
MKRIPGYTLTETWGLTLDITSSAMSMAVNALAMSLIVFKIRSVYLEVKAATTSVERTLGSTGGTKIRHIIFVIIESGMVLFSIQLVRTVVGSMHEETPPGPIINYFFIAMNQMLNVIIRSVHFCSSTSFVLLITFISIGHHTNNNFGAGFIEVVFRRQRILQ